MTSAPNQRTFTLNSDEAYEALCHPQDRSWTVLPREPRVWDLPVIVEPSAGHDERRKAKPSKRRGKR